MSADTTMAIVKLGGSWGVKMIQNAEEFDERFLLGYIWETFDSKKEAFEYAFKETKENYAEYGVNMMGEFTIKLLTK